MNSKWDPDGPSDEASGPVCIQQIHHMNTRLYTGLVAQRCARGKAGEEEKRRGEVPVFPNVNTDGNHLCPTLSYGRTATLPSAGTQTTPVWEFRHSQATRACKQRLQLQLLKWLDSMFDRQMLGGAFHSNFY